MVCWLPFAIVRMSFVIQNQEATNQLGSLSVQVRAHGLLSGRTLCTVKTQTRTEHQPSSLDEPCDSSLQLHSNPQGWSVLSVAAVIIVEMDGRQRGRHTHNFKLRRAFHVSFQKRTAI